VLRKYVWSLIKEDRVGETEKEKWNGGKVLCYLRVKILFKVEGKI